VAHFIDFHARGRPDADLFKVHAEADFNDRVLNQESLEKLVFLAEFGRFSSQEKENGERSKKIFAGSGTRCKHKLTDYENIIKEAARRCQEKLSTRATSHGISYQMLYLS
jgi:hypothetical protein